MKYYIIEDGTLAAVCPTLDSAELLIQIRSQYKQPVADTSIIRGEEEEPVPYPGVRHHHGAAGQAPESSRPTKRMPYYLLKDGNIFATVSSRKAAIETIRAKQQLETHYMLRASFSFIHGEPEEHVEIPA